MHTNHDFNHFLLHELNKQQQEAVMHKKGPLLVVAGAGSGKTRVITARITNLLLNHDVPPYAIIALTFTNKAAAQMRERISMFLQHTRLVPPFIGTFHGYCLRLLKTYAHALEHPFTTIMDEDDQQTLLNSLIKRFGLQKMMSAKTAAYQISHIKNSSRDNPYNHELLVYNPRLAELFRAYEHEKTLSKCLDFDDLLIKTVALLKKNSSVKKELHDTISHILVDEYQDTNGIQHELLKQLSMRNSTFVLDSLCVVGDEDQAIYSWRGATVENIINFRHDFPQAHMITIDQNYRSAQSILDIANKVIAHNNARNPKKLWSEKKNADPCRRIVCMSEYQEGDLIALLLKSLMPQQALTSIAILYRAHYQSRAIEEALIKQAIPYKIIGGIQFYERKEIKDMLAYLRLVINPFDRISLARVINTPTRGLGAQFEEQLHTLWESEPLLSGMDILQHMLTSSELTKVKKQAVKQFIALFEKINPGQKPAAALNEILASTDYYTYLRDNNEPDDAQERIENIKELLHAMQHMQTTNQHVSIGSFLEEVALMQEQAHKKDAQEGPVTLMSMHAAKGLEFHTIILAGLEEGILPHTRVASDPDQIEEERRLFYVGITRAQERLLLSHCRYRYSYGSCNSQRPSRFLDEIPTNLLQAFDISQAPTAQIQQLINQWLGKHIPACKVLTAAQIRKNQESLTQETKKKPAAWKKHQPVLHEKFGLGIIEDIEEHSLDKTFLTIKFKTGSKKIDARFVSNQ